MTRSKPISSRGRGLLIAGLLWFASACQPGEGERCNPLLFNDECGEGLTCTYPPRCGVAYCCALRGDGTITSTTANCQPCPALDGGMDASTSD